jgi:hypothetical protein
MIVPSETVWVAVGKAPSVTGTRRLDEATGPAMPMVVVMVRMGASRLLRVLAGIAKGQGKADGHDHRSHCDPP